MKVTQFKIRIKAISKEEKGQAEGEEEGGVKVIQFEIWIRAFMKEEEWAEGGGREGGGEEGEGGEPYKMNKRE